MRRHPARGSIAMILTLITIALISAVALDMNYKSQISAKVVANRRDYLKAYELAKAAFRWSLFRLQLDSNLDRIPPIPGTNYGGKKDDLMEIQWTMPMPYPFPDFGVLGKAVAAAPNPEDGSFTSTLMDESSKINLNDVGSGGPEGQRRTWSGASEVLENLLLMPRFHAVLGRKDHRELLWAIEDWTDVDSAVNRLMGGVEDLEYKIDGVDYNVKNGPFYTLEELRLLKPMDERLFVELKPFVTVYPFNANLPYIWTQRPIENGKINVNTASMELIAATISRQAIQDARARLTCAQQFVKSRETLSYRSIRGTEPSFLSFLSRACGGSIEAGSQNPIITSMVEKVLSVSSDIFFVEAVGHVGTAEKTIHAVVSRQDPNQPKIQYWKVF